MDQVHIQKKDEADNKTVTKEFDTNVQLAFVEARRRRNEWVTLEHLLLVMLVTDTFKDFFLSCGANFTELRNILESYLASVVPKCAPDIELEVEPTLSFQRAIQRAILKAKTADSKTAVSSLDVLAGMLEEKSEAIDFLKAQGIHAQMILDYGSQNPDKFR